MQKLPPAHRKKPQKCIVLPPSTKLVILQTSLSAKAASLAEFRGAVLDQIGNKPLDEAEIGLTKKEVRRFSLMNAIRAMANPTDRKAQEAAAFEFEAAAAAAQRAGVDPQGLFVPADVLRSWNKRT